MLELIQQWGTAAEKGGPWFLVALLGAIIFFGGRWLYSRGQKIEDALRVEIKDLQDAAVEREKKYAEAAVEREKKCAEDKNEAVTKQAELHEARYDALREESRTEHQRRNDEIKEVVVTMTAALNQESAAKHLQAKALDELTDNIRDLQRDVQRGK